MGIRPLKHVRWNLFIAIAIYLKLLTIAANISINRCSRSPRSASDDSILFYHPKAILTSLMSEFWQWWDTLAVYLFWLMTEKKYLMEISMETSLHFGILNICLYLYRKCWTNIFVFHDAKLLVPLVSTI